MKKNFKNGRNKGAAMLVSVVFFLFIMLAIISGLVTPTVRGLRNANNSIQSKQSMALSESGLEDAYYRLKNNKPIGSSVLLELNNATASTTITDSGYNEKTISALGDVNSRQRKNRLILAAGEGVSFNYGIQAGTGGFSIGNATVYGNVYSNGTIVGANGALITGSAVSAGSAGLIDNVDVGQLGAGDATAHTVRNSAVAGSLYCQSGSGNNKVCNTSLSDPAPVDMPITQAKIDEWKAHAEEGGTVAGDMTISTPTTLGPKKIGGNLAIESDLTITGTIYVTGNITTNNGAHISLISSYGSTGGIIITDGRVNLSNNVEFYGSGTPGTYVLLITTSTCPTGCSGANALEIMNNVGAILVNAQYGTVHLNNNVELNEVVGNRIVLDNNAEVHYLSGLASSSFSSGPSGGWNIQSWKEVE
jgi:hypothetical protein